jgi:sugar/nucleoside kinase (ribokinase family)
MLSILCVGHFAIDSILLPGRENRFVVLGGASTYVSLAARRLDARVAACSKVGRDFPEAYRWWLAQEGIDLSSLIKDDNTLTTRFELKYSEDLSERSLRSESRASAITIEELLSVPNADVVHVGPIVHEIGFDEIEELRKRGGVISLDPQGLVRRFDNDGNVDIVPLADRRVLGLIDIFKCSLLELRAVTGLSELTSAVKGVHDYGSKIVIVTLGAKGAVVSVEGTTHQVSAFPSEKLVDPTGAGDAFIGGFLAEYVHGEDISWCSHVGSAVASLVVEGLGPTYFGSRDEIYRRARLLYEKEIKG